jgi:hypothetical protein
MEQADGGQACDEADDAGKRDQAQVVLAPEA